MTRPGPEPWVDPVRAQIAELTATAPMGPACVAAALALLDVVADMDLPRPDVVITGPASGLLLAWRHELRHLEVDFEPDGTAIYHRWRAQWTRAVDPDGVETWAWRKVEEAVGPLSAADPAGARAAAGWLLGD
jgi:hypothetical protein